MHSTRSPWIFLKTLPLIDTCTYQALKKTATPPQKNAMDAEIQKLQDYSNQI
jgi:hypothetical protein